MKTIRLLIVDDHFFVRAGLRISFESEEDLVVCGEAGGVVEALAQLEALKPDVMLLDLRLPDGDGLDVLDQMKAKANTTAVIVFSMADNESDISRAVSAGAMGYLPKAVSRIELLEAIRTVASGQKYLPSSISAKLRSYHERTPLSPRELEILNLIVDGQPNKLIALSLGISENTVKLHITHLLAKTGAKDRTAVVKLAIQKGWVRT